MLALAHGVFLSARNVDLGTSFFFWTTGAMRAAIGCSFVELDSLKLLKPSSVPPEVESKSNYSQDGVRASRN